MVEYGIVVAVEGIPATSEEVAVDEEIESLLERRPRGCGDDGEGAGAGAGEADGEADDAVRLLLLPAPKSRR